MVLCPKVNMTIHVYFHDSEGFKREMRESFAELRNLILKELKHMALTLDDLLTKVTNLTTVDDSLVALCQGLSEQLKAAIAANDPAKIQAVADALDAETAKITAAVTANTPAAPPAA